MPKTEKTFLSEAQHADDVTRKSFSLECPHCKATGIAVWENSGFALEGRRRLVSLHGAFHEEHGRTKYVEYLIVCDQCDEIQPDCVGDAFRIRQSY